jgi:GntR family transcriptional regulator
MPTSAIKLGHRLAASLDPGSPVPIAHQIVEQIWMEVVDGSLESGERMPTVRQLAIRIGVSPRTVKWAYEELERLGVVSSQPGEGRYVGLAPPSGEERERRRAFLSLCSDMVAKTEALGFGVDDLIGALAEYRSVAREGSGRGETE